jgi:hypothetical protein
VNVVADRSSRGALLEDITRGRLNGEGGRVSPKRNGLNRPGRDAFAMCPDANVSTRATGTAQLTCVDGNSSVLWRFVLSGMFLRDMQRAAELTMSWDTSGFRLALAATKADTVS